MNFSVSKLFDFIVLLTLNNHTNEQITKICCLLLFTYRREHLKMLQKTFPYLFTDIYIARKQPQNSLKTSQKQPENSHKIAPKQSENSRETARKQPKNSPKIDAKQPKKAPTLKIRIDAYFFCTILTVITTVSTTVLVSRVV